MKVKDLIKELGNYNPDLEVKAKGDDILGTKLTCDLDRKYYVDFNFQNRIYPFHNSICDICSNSYKDGHHNAIGCYTEEDIKHRTFNDNGEVVKCDKFEPEVTIE